MDATGSGTTLLDIEEAAVYLATSARHVRRLVAERRIAYLKIGHFIRFAPDDLDTFIDASRVEPRLRL